MRKFPWMAIMAMMTLLVLMGCGGGSSDPGGSDGGLSDGGSSTGGLINPVCASGGGSAAVQAPVFVRNIPGQTGWFAWPLVADLDGDGENKLIAAYYTLYVYDAHGRRLDSAVGNGKRIYAPHVVADLEGDGVMEIVVGQGHQVWVYEWRNGQLQVKDGWPADTTTAGRSPEVRGLAVADLDGNGLIEIVATTTQTQPTEEGGAQVFVFAFNGQLYQPAGRDEPAWPRYNTYSGTGGDVDRNGAGHRGYGCYGLNVGIGDIDDDPEMEILVTFDNHHIQAFNHDGVAIDAASYFNPWNCKHMPAIKFFTCLDLDQICLFLDGH